MEISHVHAMKSVANHEDYSVHCHYHDDDSS